MFIPILLFITGLVLLVKGGDWFVDGASGIAHRFRIPEIILGATVVSIGTTLPEVMVSATGAVTGHGEMAYGNAIGSIICNTALIAALTVAIKPGKTDGKSLIVPVTFFFATALFFVVVAYIGGEFTRLTGMILLAIFVAYMITTVMSAKKRTSLMKPVTEESSDAVSEQNSSITSVVFWIVLLALGGTLVAVFSSVGIGLVIVGIAIIYCVIEIWNQKDGRKALLIKELISLVAGAAVIAIGADLLVDNGTLIAEGLGVPESVIALTFVALGTSLPELVTAITALIKGHGALSLGNIIGANLFNLVLVCGISAALAPFGVPSSASIAGINATFLIDLPVMLAVMAILTLPPLIKGKLSRWQGILLLCIYAAFCVFRFTI